MPPAKARTSIESTNPDSRSSEPTPSPTVPDTIRGADALLPMLKSASQVAFQDMFKTKDTTTEQQQESELPFPAFWSTGIIVIAPTFRIIVKIYFDSTPTSKAISEVYKKRGESLNHTHDVFREICNLMGGTLKRYLEALDTEVGLGLPFLERGFDEMFCPPVTKSVRRTDHFDIICRGSRFAVQCHTDLDDDEGLAPLLWPFSGIDCADTDADDGGMEFL